MLLVSTSLVALPGWAVSAACGSLPIYFNESIGSPLIGLINCWRVVRFGLHILNLRAPKCLTAS